MTALVLAAKAALAVLLLAAGGAKLADLDGFAVAVRSVRAARARRPGSPVARCWRAAAHRGG